MSLITPSPRRSAQLFFCWLAAGIGGDVCWVVPDACSRASLDPRQAHLINGVPPQLIVGEGVLVPPP